MNYIKQTMNPINNSVVERLLKASTDLIDSSLPKDDNDLNLNPVVSQESLKEFRNAFWVFEQQLMLGLLEITSNLE